MAERQYRLDVSKEVHREIKMEAARRDMGIRELVEEIWSFYKNKKDK